MLSTKTAKCRFCEILKNPHKHSSWVYCENDFWLICNLYYPKPDKHYYRPVCIFKKCGEMPGGHNLNVIIEILKRGMSKNEELVFQDGKHYHICIKTKGE